MRLLKLGSLKKQSLYIFIGTVGLVLVLTDARTAMGVTPPGETPANFKVAFIADQSVTTLDFSPANWSTPQTVTVTGVDDSLADGNVAYTIVTSPATGAAEYAGIGNDI